MVTSFTLDRPGIRVTAINEHYVPVGDYTLGPLTRTARNLVKTSQNWLYLHTFHVYKEHRGKGFGKVLLRDVIRRAKTMNANIILQAQPYKGSTLNQEGLVHLYKSVGFVCIHRTRSSTWMVYKRHKYPLQQGVTNGSASYF